MLPISANADYFGTIIYYKCDMANDQIIIEYRGGLNETFEKMMENKGPNAWDPWDLVTVDENQQFISKVEKIEKTCDLSDGTYNITIGPEPGNANIQGQLGARMSAWVKISRNGKEIINKTMEELWHLEIPIISKIVVKAKSLQPIITEIEQEHFYR